MRLIRNIVTIVLFLSAQAEAQSPADTSDRREDEVSTTTIHKVLAWVHFTGMVVTPILGASLHRNFSGEQITRFHQISGYFTVAALATSLVIVTF